MLPVKLGGWADRMVALVTDRSLCSSCVSVNILAQNHTKFRSQNIAMGPQEYSGV